jgi:hypothetical protein
LPPQYVPGKGVLKPRYAELKPKRDHFLRRARMGSQITIPSLIPPEGFTASMLLPEPYQGFGARCVVNLASRLMSALLPTGSPFFRFSIPAEILLRQGETEVPTELEQNLAKAEAIVMAEVERRGWRRPTNLALQHLIVAGNVMEHMLPDNRIRVLPLSQYVAVRDPSGTLVEFVIEEPVYPKALPDKLREMLPGDKAGEERTELYTGGKLVDGEWVIWQEFCDKMVEGSYSVTKISPFSVLRWATIAGEDYGRGKVEEHIADLRAIDGLSKAMTDGAAMASRNITMLRPNAAGGVNLLRRFTKANNGDLIVGNPDDVEMKQFENQAGMQFTSVYLTELKKDVGTAFLMFGAQVRDAERVTAYELSRLAEELEGTLGGVYTELAQDMMHKRLDRLVVQMRDKRQLPPFQDGQIEWVVLTGLSALGREKQADRAMQLIGNLAQLPPEIVGPYPKWDVLLTTVFNGAGIPNAINTQAEVEQILNQQAARQALASGAEAALSDPQGLAEAAQAAGTAPTG